MNRRLSATEKAKITGLYNERLEREGRGHAVVGWGSKEDQQLRFSVLLRGFDPRGKRILDVGCGLGDLVAYLDTVYGEDYDYVGVDISEKLVEDARVVYGVPRRRFVVHDILEGDLEPADIVVLSGALSMRIDDNVAYAQTMLRRMFELSRDGAAVNFLSSYVDYEEPKNFHYSPEKLFTFGKSLTPWVTVHHDYPLWEFTLQLRKESLPEKAA